jgi:hypothetical protein
MCASIHSHSSSAGTPSGVLIASPNREAWYESHGFCWQEHDTFVLSDLASRLV